MNTNGSQFFEKFILRQLMCLCNRPSSLLCSLLGLLQANTKADMTHILLYTYIIHACTYTHTPTNIDMTADIVFDSLLNEVLVSLALGFFCRALRHDVQIPRSQVCRFIYLRQFMYA